MLSEETKGTTAFFGEDIFTKNKTCSPVGSLKGIGTTMEEGDFSPFLSPHLSPALVSHHLHFDSWSLTHFACF